MKLKNILIAPLVAITALIEMHYFICKAFIGMKDSIDPMLPRFEK